MADKKRGPGTAGRPEILHDLRTGLRDTADAHRPDRERMLARIERGIAGPEADGRRRRGYGHRRAYGPAPWARVVGVTAGLVAAFGVGGLAVGLTTGPGERQTVITTPPGYAAPPRVPPATSRQPQPGTSPSASATTDPPSRTPSPGAVTTAPPVPSGSGTGTAAADPSATPVSPGSRKGNHPQDRYLWSDGSIDPSSHQYWAQSNVTVKTEQKLTKLTVELWIAQTGGVAATGSFSTLKVDDCSVSVREEDGGLVYTWTLKDGVTLSPGTYEFAGQYNHAQGGRNAGGDSYGAQADGPDSAVEVRGDFF